MNWNDDDDRTPAVSTGRPVQHNFVAPAPIVPVQRVEVLPPAAHELTTVQPTQTVQRLDTSHVDRAKGFQIATLPLAMLLGVVALLVAVVAFGVPLASMAALLVVGAVFAGAWLLAWIWFQSASPDGVALWMVILHFRLLRHEQKARHERMRQHGGEQ